MTQKLNTPAIISWDSSGKGKAEPEYVYTVSGEVSSGFVTLLNVASKKSYTEPVSRIETNIASGVIRVLAEPPSKQPEPLRLGIVIDGKAELEAATVAANNLEAALQRVRAAFTD